MIVCHNSGTLDCVCKIITHYEPNLKLKSYVRNVSESVKRRQQAKA